MKRHAPSTERNRAPILAVLQEVLPSESARVLEIASGSGEHAVHFARALPGVTWQPTDPSADALASIDAWRDEAALPNLLPPIRLDASEPEWPVTHADAIVCINMIHIAPWAACEGLLSGAARVLPPGGRLVLYGPYFRDDLETAPSNVAFDEWLRAQNSEWGVRRLEEVVRVAESNGLRLERVVEMPSNNLTVVLER